MMVFPVPSRQTLICIESGPHEKKTKSLAVFFFHGLLIEYTVHGKCH